MAWGDGGTPDLLSEMPVGAWGAGRGRAAVPSGRRETDIFRAGARAVGGTGGGARALMEW